MIPCSAYVVCDAKMSEIAGRFNVETAPFSEYRQCFTLAA